MCFLGRRSAHFQRKTHSTSNWLSRRSRRFVRSRSSSSELRTSGPRRQNPETKTPGDVRNRHCLYPVPLETHSCTHCFFGANDQASGFIRKSDIVDSPQSVSSRNITYSKLHPLDPRFIFSSTIMRPNEAHSRFTFLLPGGSPTRQSTVGSPSEGLKPFFVTSAISSVRPTQHRFDLGTGSDPSPSHGTHPLPTSTPFQPPRW